MLTYRMEMREVHKSLAASAEKLTFFGVRGIASEAYSYGAGQFSKSKLNSLFYKKGEIRVMSIYQFTVKTIDGEEISLKQYEGKVLLIVNTASKCGFTPQYKELQQIYEQYKDQGLVVLGFPCNQFMNQESGSENEIKSFCELNYGVTFPMFAKVDVNGVYAHPLFVYLRKQTPGILGLNTVKWNFTKFLVDAKGNVVKRYSPTTKPKDIVDDFVDLL
jgi:glutathione peroxidase